MNIQIVVPVYNAFEVFEQALLSLLKHNSDDEVVLINDASTDERIKQLLATDLPNTWKVITNKTNLGFVKTANLGLRRSDGHSILLNSDTLVTAGWLDRFKAVIAHYENIGKKDADGTVLGTATPWSNNAEICSIPQTLCNNPIPDDIDDLAIELREKHQAVYPEIPTAVGFCMLITALAKTRVGYFDEATFGIGYGEENDYSMRVHASGLKNVLVDDCYIAHIGNQSFGALDLKPNAQTMQRLLAKHPAYLELIQNFIEKDPLGSLRQRIIDKISLFNC